MNNNNKEMKIKLILRLTSNEVANEIIKLRNNETDLVTEINNKRNSKIREKESKKSQVSFVTPQRSQLITVRRSPHVNKKHRDQFHKLSSHVYRRGLIGVIEVSAQYPSLQLRSQLHQSLDNKRMELTEKTPVSFISRIELVEVR